MSRSGYSDDLDDNWSLIKWRGMVASASRGKRGQKFFMELLAALDAMPQKRLIAHELETPSGEVCAIGSLGKARGLDMSTLDPEDSETVAFKFDIADCLAREIVYVNDEGSFQPETPEDRFARMRKWVASNITPASPPDQSARQTSADENKGPLT